MAQRYCAILEYRMSDGAKRVDAVLLLAGAVLVVEMKGDGNWQPESKEFLWKKYADRPDARFGLMTSSRNKRIGAVIEEPERAKFLRAGPWYADPESSPHSCRRLQEAITEFAAQGLELDHALVIWGTDFVRQDGRWDNSAAKTYRKSSGVQDALQLRRNAYRVLLTRGREGAILCLPEFMRELDETYAALVAAGCDEMRDLTSLRASPGVSVALKARV